MLKRIVLQMALFGLVALMTGIPSSVMGGNESTGEGVPTECGGSWSDDSPCQFACYEGDYIYVQGTIIPDWRFYHLRPITVTASCGGVQSSCTRRAWVGSCQVESEESVIQDDPEGTCRVTGYGFFRCRSVTPEEAAQLEAEGEGWIIKVPGR